MTFLQAVAGNVQTQLALAAKGGADGLKLSGVFPRVTVYHLRPSAPIVLDLSDATIASLAFQDSANWQCHGGRFVGAVYAANQILGCDNLGFYDADYSGFGTAGISIGQSSNITVARNRLHLSLGDGVDIGASQGCAVVDNFIFDLTYASDPPGLHSDGVQWWNVKGQKACSDLTISRNAIVTQSQGIGCYSPYDLTDPGYERIVCEDNLISTTMTWAMHGVNCRNSVFRRNHAQTRIGSHPGWGGARIVLTDNIAGKPDSGRSGNVLEANTEGLPA